MSALAVTLGLSHVHRNLFPPFVGAQLPLVPRTGITRAADASRFNSAGFLRTAATLSSTNKISEEATATMTGMKLYWGSGSLFAWRAMITLEEKGLSYEGHLISFSNKEHKSEDYIKMNPRGQVPSFSDGDVVIHESGAICQYLETFYTSGTKLMPEDKAHAGQVLQYIWEANNVYPVSRPLMFGDGTEDQKEALRRELRFWDKHCEGKKYLVGDAFTLADVILFPQVATLHRFGLDFDKAGFPNLTKYYEGLKDRESIQKTWPPHWKDGPGNGRLSGI